MNCVVCVKMPFADPERPPQPAVDRPLSAPRIRGTLGMERAHRGMELASLNGRGIYPHLRQPSRETAKLIAEYFPAAGTGPAEPVARPPAEAVPRPSVWKGNTPLPAAAGRADVAEYETPGTRWRLGMGPSSEEPSRTLCVGIDPAPAPRATIPPAAEESLHWA